MQKSNFKIIIFQKIVTAVKKKKVHCNEKSLLFTFYTTKYKTLCIFTFKICTWKKCIIFEVKDKYDFKKWLNILKYILTISNVKNTK